MKPSELIKRIESGAADGELKRTVRRRQRCFHIERAGQNGDLRQPYRP